MVLCRRLENGAGAASAPLQYLWSSAAVWETGRAPHRRPYTIICLYRRLPNRAVRRFTLPRCCASFSARAYFTLFGFWWAATDR